MKYNVEESKVVVEFDDTKVGRALQTSVISILEAMYRVQNVCIEEQVSKLDEDEITERTRKAAIEVEVIARKNVEQNTPLGAEPDKVGMSVGAVPETNETEDIEQDLPPLEDEFEELEIEQDI